MTNELREILELTLEQQRIKRLIDLRRAKLDQFARDELERTGAAPTWKIRGLGTIRLDGAGVDPEPIAYIADENALASYVAERTPTEAIATIVVPAGKLAEALEALGYAGIEPERSTVVARSHQAAAVLASATLVLDDDADAVDGAAPKYLAVDPDGQVIPGVAGRLTDPQPRLVVVADKEAKAAVIAAADAELETDAETDAETAHEAPADADAAAEAGAA